MGIDHLSPAANLTSAPGCIPGQTWIPLEKTDPGFLPGPVCPRRFIIPATVQGVAEEETAQDPRR